MLNSVRMVSTEALEAATFANASKAPAWLKAAGALVAWLWSLEIAEITALGPAVYPMRHPVMAKVLETPLTVITRSFSSFSEHAAKAIKYSKLAAGQAELSAAWAEAIGQYERCLLTMASSPGEDFGEDEAALLVSLGIAARNDANWRTGWRSFMRARNLFNAREDVIAFAQATG